jgi:hypothetical protein
MPVTTTQKVLSEDVLTTKQACEELRPIFGKPIDRTTLYRWALRGIRGTHLEYTKIGGRIVTSRQAIARFIEARSH